MNPTTIVEHSKQNTDPMKSTVDPPKQNPSSIAETSQENTIKGFSFQVHPAITLKQALACLSEEHFNPDGLVMIEVGEVGLEMTVGSSNATVAQLWLKATGLIDFKCSKPMINNWVNSKHIFQNLADADDKDTVTIHHLDGTNQLFFSFGSDPPTQFSERLFEHDDVDYEKLPNITYACEAVILSDHLKQMIEKYEAADPKIVLVNISKEELKIVIEGKNWSYSYKDGDKMDGIRGVIGEQKHHAWFQWPDCEFLKKAALVAPGFLLCLATDPPQCIMLRFNLRELGDLVYVQKSVMTVFNSPIQSLEEELAHLAELHKPASPV